MTKSQWVHRAPAPGSVIGKLAWMRPFAAAVYSCICARQAAADEEESLYVIIWSSMGLVDQCISGFWLLLQLLAAPEAREVVWPS